jgi:MSHA pilin protein MshD
MSSRRPAAGFSLIELVIFIVVLGIGIAGAVVLFNQVTVASVDPMVRKQTLALASSLLEEIELKPFTYCDPDDPKVFTATDSTAAQCTTLPEAIGPDAGETRYAAPRFDNVNDYHGFEMGSGTANPGIKTAESDGTAATNITALQDYAVRVTVADASATTGVAAGESLKITVTAKHVPTGVTVTLEGYRLRYAPNSP